MVTAMANSFVVQSAGSRRGPAMIMHANEVLLVTQRVINYLGRHDAVKTKYYKNCSSDLIQNFLRLRTLYFVWYLSSIQITFDTR